MDLTAVRDTADLFDLFDGWTLPDGACEEFGAPLTREQLVARFVARCAAERAQAAAV
ncbi:hypothetical protein [Kineococcus indalonis]|uniref:hypothetical protein n=1 Tax=Kineococcus indalonis TaxID=2696566 RepID=UPI00141284E8|nr:hypothetical protein [Kineococcus indalonis]NAZ88207.1 hypothetical protein [Kineococcus indalonis]